MHTNQNSWPDKSPSKRIGFAFFVIFMESPSWIIGRQIIRRCYVVP